MLQDQFQTASVNAHGAGGFVRATALMRHCCDQVISPVADTLLDILRERFVSGTVI